MPSPRKKVSKRRAGRKWSGRVTATSNAMTLEQGVFRGHDPKRMARSIKRSAEASTRRKSGPYRSAVSMLNFYENRGGKNLTPAKHRTLRRAKAELKKQFQRE